MNNNNNSLLELEERLFQKRSAEIVYEILKRYWPRNIPWLDWLKSVELQEYKITDVLRDKRYGRDPEYGTMPSFDIVVWNSIQPEMRTLLLHNYLYEWWGRRDCEGILSLCGDCLPEIYNHMLSLKYYDWLRGMLK